MAELIKDKKDTVWAFILKNIYKPLYLRDEKFDIVIGNPPWLSYRYVESTDHQNFLKKMILEKYNLPGKERAELIGDNMAKEFTCAAPGCKFRIRSSVDDEVVNAAIWHAKTSHKTDISREREFEALGHLGRRLLAVLQQEQHLSSVVVGHRLPGTAHSSVILQYPFKYRTPSA
jgi:predicted small metal-binding protein